MTKTYFDLQQGSVDWYRLRAGIPTASRFHEIMTPKKMQPAEARKAYACQIIAARLLNWQPDNLTKIDHVQTGKENEPLAVAQLELMHDIETREIGFVTTDDGRFGASPDRVVMSGDRIAISAEVKCPTIPIQMRRIIFGHGDDYICQVQGQLLVAEADKALFLSFHPRMPPCHTETGRDEPFIANLADCLERFSDELEAWTEIATRAGLYQAFDAMRTPAEAEYGQNLHDQTGEDELESLISGELSQRFSWGG